MNDVTAYAKMVFQEMMDEVLSSEYDVDLVVEQIGDCISQYLNFRYLIFNHSID